MRSLSNIFTTRPPESARPSCMAGVAVTRTDLQHWIYARKAAVSLQYACMHLYAFSLHATIP